MIKVLSLHQTLFMSYLMTLVSKVKKKTKKDKDSAAPEVNTNP